MTATATTALFANPALFQRQLFKPDPGIHLSVQHAEREDDVWSDEALIEKFLKRGKPQHFQMLMARHKTRVHHIAQSVLGPQNSADAEDVTQEVFIQLYQRLQKFRGDSKFSTWLYRMTFNLAIDYYRKRVRQKAVPIESVAEAAGPDSGGTAVDDLQRSAAILAAIQKLSDEQRTMVHLFYWLGYKTQEISATLGCPEGTVKVYLLRARKSLAKQLQSTPYGFDHESI